jgi:hypothetical protein
MKQSPHRRRSWQLRFCRKQALFYKDAISICISTELLGNPEEHSIPEEFNFQRPPDRPLSWPDCSSRCHACRYHRQSTVYCMIEITVDNRVLMYLTLEKPKL